jgi:hypothetical protein
MPDEHLEEEVLLDIHRRYQLVWDELSDDWIGERRRGLRRYPAEQPAAPQSKELR